MANFDFKCQKCGRVFEEWHRVGRAPDESSCPDCGASSMRYFSALNFKCEGPTSNAKFNREMTERNEKAAERMRRNRDPLV